MKTITREYKVYPFDELSDKAKDKALDNLYDINVDYEWWESVYDDAKQVGLEIRGFDIGRGNDIKARLLVSIEESVKRIMENHGDKTDTYKLANEYKTGFTFDEDGELENREEKTEEYEKALAEEYLSMLRKEYDYLTSREGIIETIEANEYEFTEDGKMFK